MKQFMLDIEKLVIDGPLIAPVSAERFRREVEVALTQRVEKQSTASGLVAKAIATSSIAGTGAGEQHNPAKLAGQIAQAIHQSLPRKGMSE